MTDILSQFRDEDLPPSNVDIQGAVRAGHRRRRFRIGLAAAIVAVAVATAAATPEWLSAQPGPVLPAEPACGRPEPTRSSLPTWERFDPFTLEIDASGVSGYRVMTSATAAYGQLVVLDWEGDEPRLVTVMLLACGGEPHLFEADRAVPFDPGTGEPASQVGGAPAYWLPPNKLYPDTIPSQGLAWQWTPGAWALVVAFSGPDTPVDPTVLRTVATQVAPQLAFGVASPVTSPFSLPVPEGTYPSFTVTQMATDAGQTSPVGFSIGFNTIGTAEPTNPFGNSAGYQPSLVVEASAQSTLNDRPDNATAYPDDLGGYKAFQAVVDDGLGEVDALLVYEFFGFGLQITPRDLPGASTKEQKLRRAADIFRTITVYPNAATDQTAWGDPILP